MFSVLPKDKSSAVYNPTVQKATLFLSVTLLVLGVLGFVGPQALKNMGPAVAYTLSIGGGLIALSILSTKWLISREPQDQYIRLS